MGCIKFALAAAGLAGVASNSLADSITADVTADNHYALYSFSGGAFSLHGQNETGAAGNPGAYNWSLPEHHVFDPGEALYIAAWSDGSVAQGLIGDFLFSSLGPVPSGDSRWRVFGTGIGLGDGAAAPTADAMAGYVAAADAGALWEAPFVGGPNGVEPWGLISGVSSGARWMWRADPGNANALIGGSSGAELLVFRLNVKAPTPSPGTASVVLAGGLLACTRRRRTA